MPTELPLLFALHGSEDYASRVARHLGLELAAHEEREFEDGEHKSRALTPVEGRKAVVFHALHGDDRQSANDKLCRLLFFCAALKDAGARRVQVVAPYLCYARKDRRTKFQDPIITRYVAGLFEQCGVDPNNDTVVYCRIGERSSHTWFVLTYLLGLNNVRNYDGSWTEWGNKVGAPIEKSA